MGATVPDLRGLFLRGTGGNAAPLGQIQGDAIRNVSGSFGGTNDANGGLNPTGPFSYIQTTTIQVEGKFARQGRVTLDISRVVPTAEENRPVNIAVRYLVRARP